MMYRRTLLLYSESSQTATNAGVVEPGQIS